MSNCDDGHFIVKVLPKCTTAPFISKNAVARDCAVQNVKRLKRFSPTEASFLMGPSNPHL